MVGLGRKELRVKHWGLMGLLLPVTLLASVHYQAAGFDVNTGELPIYSAAAQTERPIWVNGHKRFLFNRACRKDIYNAATGKYITACSAMVLSSINGKPGQQVGVVGFCNPAATTPGKQYTNRIMYMPNGGEQNCLFETAATHSQQATLTFSCPCHLPAS